MSAHTASAKKATEFVKDPEPVTPVIIKSGSGGGGLGIDEAPHLVEIESRLMPFAALSDFWETSQSTLFGRVTAISINDGTEADESPQTLSLTIKPSAELVSVQIDFETDKLNVSENGDIAQKQVALNIESREVHFTDSSGDDWTTANATFDDKITSVTVMVGSRLALRHDCENTDVTVTILFDLNSRTQP
jgi:hypothetical protein